MPTTYAGLYFEKSAYRKLSARASGHIMMLHSDRNVGTKFQNGVAVTATFLVS